MAADKHVPIRHEERPAGVLDDEARRIAKILPVDPKLEVQTRCTEGTDPDYPFGFPS
jgi:hypothetical protein